MPVPPLTSKLARWERYTCRQFGENEQGNEPTPGEKLEGEVMPECNEGEYEYRGWNCISCSTKRDVYVPKYDDLGSTRELRSVEECTNRTIQRL
jgi:hypothetical protein